MGIVYDKRIWHDSRSKLDRELGIGKSRRVWEERRERENDRMLAEKMERVFGMKISME